VPNMANTEKAKMLSCKDLAEVVRNAPLVSIDLIIENPQGQVLVGMRNNEPAKGMWFVPGGRILKNERISEAFERIMKNELALDIPYSQAEFFGVFEHLYPTNFARLDGFGTHYVVLSHWIKLKGAQQINPDNQHSDMKWLDKQEILTNEKVHPNTKAYFC